MSKTRFQVGDLVKVKKGHEYYFRNKGRATRFVVMVIVERNIRLPQWKGADLIKIKCLDGLNVGKIYDSYTERLEHDIDFSEIKELFI